MRQRPIFRDRFKIKREDFDGDFVFATKGNWWMSDFDEDVANWRVPDMGGLLFLTKWNLLLRTIGIEVDEWEGITYTIFTFSVATLDRESPKLRKPQFSEEPAHEEQGVIPDPPSEITPSAGEYDPWKQKAKCRAKVQYHSMHEADAAAIHYALHFGTPYSAYHCPVCHMIHLTTKVKNAAISIPEVVEHTFTPFAALLPSDETIQGGNA